MWELQDFFGSATRASDLQLTEKKSLNYQISRSKNLNFGHRVQETLA